MAFVSNPGHAHALDVFRRLLADGCDLDTASACRAKLERDAMRIYCAACGKDKPISAFYLSHAGTLTEQYTIPCKDCQSGINAARWAARKAAR